MPCYKMFSGTGGEEQFVSESWLPHVAIWHWTPHLPSAISFPVYKIRKKKKKSNTFVMYFQVKNTI